MKAAEFPPDDFRNMDTWRIFRIIAEFVEGIERMTKLGPSVTLFGSARVKKDTPYYEMARVTAKLLAQQNFNIITGGGPGVMEAANRGARESNRKASVGLNIDLPFEQEPNKFISELITFRYFFVRKVCFLKYSVAIVTYPGGFGTLDEFSEALTLIQTSKVRTVPLVAVGKEYWGPLFDWFRTTMLRDRMINEDDLNLFYVAENADDAFQYIKRVHDRSGVKSTVRKDI